jgi:hypothetical protein
MFKGMVLPIVMGILLSSSVLAEDQQATGHQYHGGQGMHQGSSGHKGGHKGHGMKEVMKYADQNDDGEITHEEFMRAKWAYFNNKFQKLDRNGDGVVSHREFMEFHRDKGEGMFKKKDANGDGVISAEEQAQAMLKKKGMDHGKDCKMKMPH